jgi:hypothetical protein
MSKNPDFIIQLVAEKGWPTSPEQRLKMGLKRLLRSHGLRCTDCRPFAPRDEKKEAGR